jgi:predicted N-acyltransferase
MPATRCSIREKISQCDAGQWDEIVGASGSDILMSHRFVAAVEDAFEDQARFAHAVVYDDRRAVACGSFCAFRLDLNLLADGLTRRVTEIISRPLPSLLRRTIILCGLPVSVGAKHLAIAPGARHEDVLRAMHETAVSFARRERAPYIIFKEFSSDDRAMTDFLEKLGYRRFSSPPMNLFGHRFPDMDSYTAALRSRYRQCVRRSLAKSRAAGLRYERLTDTGAILRLYGPALHRLYEAVTLSSAHRLELLPLSFFHSLARRLPGRVGLTVVYDGDRVAAFNWNLFDGETYHFLFAGLDYELNPLVDLYFNLMYAEMDCAFRAGAETLVFGQTADDFKTRLGCHQERRFFYVAPTGRVASLILRAAGAFLLPEPPRWATHHVFRDPDPVPRGRCRCR